MTTNTDNEYLSQEVIIVPLEGEELRLDLENNYTIDDIFTRQFIGEDDTDRYTVLLDEDAFKQVFEDLTVFIGYDLIEKDDREGCWDLYDLMCGVIRDGKLDGVKMEYCLFHDEEE